MERTWFAFFSRFGRLTEAQRYVIPFILRGGDVLLCAATASGKTEAACAPLVERNLSRTHPWTILYISPTRALVNDLHARLEAPLRLLGLRLARRTGEHREGVAAAPHVLLTTPESFDSMLCRGRVEGPQGHLLSNVTAVVLDEIHLLHGTPRGEQVRWLLRRLRRLRTEAHSKGWSADAQLQVIGLSATLSDPKAVAGTYLTDGQIITVPGGREIQTVAAPCEKPRVEDALPAYLAGLQHSEKVLVFANTRKRVDELTAALRSVVGALGYHVLAHHSSLDRRLREAAEEAARKAERMVLVATATLEIGIDIGNIDLVVLDGPPPDIPALLQRIGRGNRRTSVTRVMACAGSLSDVLVQSAMIEAARDGWLGPQLSGPQHGVAIQQVASYILQGARRSRPRAKLQGLLTACAHPFVAQSLLDHLVRSGELEEDAAGIRLGAGWLEAASRGEIHANIEGSFGATVEDAISGTKLATGVRFGGGRSLQVGGELLGVRRWSERKIEVVRIAGSQTADGHWGYSSRAWARGPGQPQAVRRYLGLHEHTWPMLVSGRHTHVFHFGGARRRAVLELAADGQTGVRVNDWYLTLPLPVMTKPLWLENPSRTMAELQLVKRLEHLEAVLARPAMNRRLPTDARLDEVRGWLALESELAETKSAVWSTAVDPSLRIALAALAGTLEQPVED